MAMVCVSHHGSVLLLVDESVSVEAVQPRPVTRLPRLATAHRHAVAATQITYIKHTYLNTIKNYIHMLLVKLT